MVSLQGHGKGRAEDALGVAVREVVEDVGALVRDRISSAAADLADHATRAATSGALLVGATLLSVAGLGAFTGGLVGSVRGRRRRALLVGLAYEAGAAGLVVAARIRRRPPPG